MVPVVKHLAPTSIELVPVAQHIWYLLKYFARHTPLVVA